VGRGRRRRGFSCHVAAHSHGFGRHGATEFEGVEVSRGFIAALLIHRCQSETLATWQSQASTLAAAQPTRAKAGIDELVDAKIQKSQAGAGPTQCKMPGGTNQYHSPDSGALLACAQKSMVPQFHTEVLVRPM